MSENLTIMDADTLLSTPMQRASFIIDGFLPQGVSILSGAPKIGKSWLMLLLSLKVSQGLPLWGMKTDKCDVLYLCLEDSFQRIQYRLYRLTESAPDNLYFAVTSGQIGNGLQKQIHHHMKEYPATRLIIIDTLQKVRNTENGNKGMYAADYDDITALKRIADRYCIAIVIVHHLRKQKDISDPFNQISGTTGITGAVDSAYVITKGNRFDDTALMTASGRDIEHQQLILKFDDCVWQLIERKDQEKLREEEIPPVLFRIVRFIKDEKIWQGTATQLLTALGDTQTSPVILTRLITRHYYEVFVPEGIEYKSSRTSDSRLIHLRVNDENDTNDRNSFI